MDDRALPFKVGPKGLYLGPGVRRVQRPLLLVVSTSSCPIPPVAGGSYTKTIYLLAEGSDRLGYAVISGWHKRLERFDKPLRGHYFALKPDNKMTRLIDSIPLTGKLKNMLLGSRTIRGWRYIGAVIHVARKLRPDCIVVYDGPAMIPVLRRALGDTPLVLYQHGHSYFFDVARHKDVYGKLDGLIALSHRCVEFEFNRSCELVPIVKVAYNFVDTDRFKPDLDVEKVQSLRSRFGLNGSKIIGIVATLGPKKGAHLIVHSLPRILKRVPNAKLLIVGGAKHFSSSMDPYMTKLKRMAELLAPGRVVFTGYIPNEDLPLVYNLLDVFVCPSVCHEGFGMTIIESMACGTPVLASSVGGIPDIICNGKDGLLVPRPYEEDAFVEPIVTLLEDDEMRARMGKAARQTVEERFTLGVAREQFEGFILRLIQSRRQRSI